MKQEQIVHIKIAASGQKSAANFNAYYDVLNSYSNVNEKVIIGEEFNCRFCNDNERQNFKKDNAHTFPEFAGNKWLFSKDECKNCNKLFSEYENEFANFALSMRTLSGIKTKKNKSPKIKTKKSTIQNIDGELLFHINSQQLQNINQKQISIKHIDEHCERIELTVKGNDYVPIYFLKSLFKIAFSIMPKKELDSGNFQSFKKWLLDKHRGFENDFNEPYFFVLFNKLKYAKRSPLLLLYKKKADYEKSNFATYVFLFSFGYHIYQCFLPYVDNDKWMLEKSDLDLFVIPEILMDDGINLNIQFLNCMSFERKSPKEETYNIYKK